LSRFLLSCGGTGGHLSPGIALAEGLAERGHEVTLVISRKKVDARLIEKYAPLHFVRLPGTGFSWRPSQMMRFAISHAAGFAASLSLVRRARPDAIVGFGGFTSIATVLAGRLCRVPVTLHESNRVPGLAVRTLGRLAQRVYLPLGVRIGGVRSSAIRNVGLPVRKEIQRLPAGSARESIGLDPHQRVLVVFGGSQGASPLNDWCRGKLDFLASQGIQVCCVTGLGKGGAETLELKSSTGEAVRAIYMPFCDHMAELLSAADLVVARAGAGTLAELVRCEAPAILIPYPQAASDHQRANALFFERQGGGIVVEQSALGSLHSEVMDVIFNDSLLRKFRGNLRRMDRANSLEFMLRDLESVASGGPGGTAAADPAPAGT